MNNISTPILVSGISYSQLLNLLVPLFGGALLGMIFFAGLYWTVRRATQSTHPALYFLSSFLLRTALVLSGFYLLTDGQWPRLLAVIIGFVGARIAVITISRGWSEKSKTQESRDAP
jgi:F1F0 ATPase subunit 2